MQSPPVQIWRLKWLLNISTSRSTLLLLRSLGTPQPQRIVFVPDVESCSYDSVLPFRPLVGPSGTPAVWGFLPRDRVSTAGQLL